MRILMAAFKQSIHAGFSWLTVPPLLLLAFSGIDMDPISIHSSEIDTLFSAYSAEIPNSDRSIEMVPVPGGTFRMGPFGDGAVHDVKVDSFWIGKYEITWNEYNLFRNEAINGIRSEVYSVLYGVDIDADAVSAPTLTEEALELLREADVPPDIISLPSPPYSDMTAGMGSDGFPAVSMTHYAAFMFTKWLTVKTGEFYRLPTEAEWEYACRAASPEEYKPITDQAELNRFAWHRANSNRQYQKPGSKEPNGMDIHDMLGNVAEYTFDQYYEDYVSRLESEPAENPFFKPTELYPRAVRGGSWMDQADSASCLQRRGTDPGWKMRDPQLPKSLWWHTNAPFVGFRIVKPVKQPDSVDEMQKYWIEAIQDYN